MRRGFTLIELLVVLGIITILVSIVLVAINPLRKLGLSRDAQRITDVNTVLNAVYQYSLDHSGNFPSGIPTGAAREICVTGAASCVNGVDLTALVPQYVVSMPRDPRATGTGTEYLIVRGSNDRLTVSAPRAEYANQIEAIR